MSEQFNGPYQRDEDEGVGGFYADDDDDWPAPRSRWDVVYSSVVVLLLAGIFLLLLVNAARVRG